MPSPRCFTTSSTLSCRRKKLTHLPLSSLTMKKPSLTLVRTTTSTQSRPLTLWAVNITETSSCHLSTTASTLSCQRSLCMKKETKGSKCRSGSSSPHHPMAKVPGHLLTRFSPLTGLALRPTPVWTQA